MKKISNVFKALFALAALTALVSCSNELKEKDSASLRISFSESARTVMPDFSISDLKDLELKSGEDVLANWTSIGQASDSVIEIDSENIGNTVSYTLTAKKGTVEYSGSTSLTVHAGENELAFKLSPKDFGEGKGNVSYTFSFDGAENADKVSYIEIALISYSSTPSKYKSYYLNSEPKIVNNSVTFAEQDVAAGNYYITVDLYSSSSEYLLRWREDVQIADGATSVGSTHVDAVNAVYTLTKNYNYEGSSNTTLSVTRFTTYISSPSPRKGYLFGGWYTDAACSAGNEFSITKTPVTSNLTIYAKWISNKNDDGSYNIASGNISDVLEDIIESKTETSASKSVVLKLSGSLNSSNLSTIRNYLKNYNTKSENPIYYTLDFSGVTSSNYLTSLTDCDTLTSITLNSSVSSITPADFKDCSSLKEIIIPSANTSLKNGADGAVYSKDGKTLYVYPQANNADTFTISSGVTTISKQAFCGADISAFAVAAGNSVYKSVNGVLFSADERNLIAYPAGNSATSYEVPAKTLCIYPSAFARSKLSDITTEDETCVLKYSSSYYKDIFNSSVSDVTAQDKTAYIKNSSYYIYNGSIACVAYDAEEVTVYDNVNKTVNNVSYTISKLTSSESTKWYKITSTAGSQYKLFSCGRYTYSDFVLDNTLSYSSFASCTINVYDTTGNRITTSSNSALTFTAEGNVTYIYVEPQYSYSYSTGNFAFRVMNYDPDAEVTNTLSAVVEVLQDDINVTKSENSNYINFYVNLNSHRNLYWYVDGKQVSTSYSFYFYFSDYSKGTHIVTCEVQGTDYQWYSYSAQVKVQ